MWIEVPLAGRLVNSRKDMALGAGEFSKLANVRLGPGDDKQLKPERAASTFDIGSGIGNVDVIGVFFLSFEGATDKLLVVWEDNTNSYLYTTDADDGQVFVLIKTIAGSVATKATVVHHGDQYYLGTDVGNYLIEDASTVTDLGLVAPQNLDDGAVGDVIQTFAHSTSGTSAFKNTDLLVYIMVEYDADLDVESPVMRFGSGTTTTGYESRVQFSKISPSVDGEGVRISTANWTQRNTRATGVNIYRGIILNGSTMAADEVEEELNRMIGGRGEEVFPATFSLVTKNAPFNNATAYLDYGSMGRFGGPFRLPAVILDNFSGIFERHRNAGNFTVATIYQSSLVANDPDTSPQVLRYSPPNEVEYQPVPYFMYFATERDDEIVGLHQINGRLVVLLKQSVHRVNYLPFEGELRAEQGRVQETITGHQGCVGRHASAKIETAQGELVVWLSREGLRWSNGIGWDDACPDWSMDGVAPTEANIPNATLLNDARDYRLMLFLDGKRWDFYYHPALMVNGKLRATGPHSSVSSLGGSTFGIIKGGASGLPSGDTWRVWVHDGSEAAWVNSDALTSQSMELDTGYLKADNPMRAIEVRNVALETSAGSGNVTSCSVTLKHTENEDTTDSDSVTLFSAAAPGDDVYRDALEGRGNRLKVELDISNNAADWRFGPLWMDIQVVGDGDG